MLKALPALDKVKAKGDEKIGVDIIRRAVVAPIKQIAKNAGLDGSIVAQKVLESKKKNFGYDALRKEYGDMVEFGVIVPTKVERVSIDCFAPANNRCDCQRDSRKERYAARRTSRRRNVLSL